MIINKPSKKNLVADCLSMFRIVRDSSPVEDDFPDEHLFVVSAITPWYADIANFLATGNLDTLGYYRKSGNNPLVIGNY